MTGLAETAEVYSIHANLLYEPVPGLTFGSELLFAERTLESGASGDMTRVLLSARYAF